jgi:hypothetical protein
MQLRRVLVTVATICAVLAIAAWAVLEYAPEVKLEFTGQQLQEQLAPRFPSKKCVLSACVELRNPRVLLQEGSDRLTVDADFVATLGNRSMPGTARLDGKPSYDKATGNFFLLDVRVSEFKMSGNAPDFDEVVKVRGPAVLAAIMNRMPLYAVSSHPKYGSVAKLALRSVQVVDGKLVVVFTNPLLLFGN